MWSLDIYSKYFNKNATDSQNINSGRMAIIFSLCTALLMSMVLLYLKFDSPESAFTHTLNNLRYYINCGIVVLIISAVLLIKPKIKAALHFLKHHGDKVVITSIDKIKLAIEKKSGTIIRN